MGQAGSSEQSALWMDENGRYPGHLALDEEIARHLQEQELIEDSLNVDVINERELQIARDAELAHYMDANHGELPEEFRTDGINGEYQWAGTRKRSHDDAFADEETPIVTGAFPGSETNEIVTCVACGDQNPQHEILQAPCGDYYCGECLEHVFRQSMEDEQYFPPRCHRQEILLSQAKGLIGHDLAVAFEAKYVELSTPNRTYCYDVACNIFIPPQAISRDIGLCGRCGRTTCSMCKDASHVGDCPQDTALQQLIQTAEQQGRKRCQRCSRMIELTHGCNHMSCPCGYEFCYVCNRGPWKNCRCNAFDLRRLLYEAEQVVNQNRDVQNEADQQQENAQRGRIGQPPHLANQGHQARIDQVAEQLLNNHDGCQHPMPWSRYQQGEHECWVCHRRKGNKVVGRCRRCYFVACYPCRRAARNRM